MSAPVSAGGMFPRETVLEFAGRLRERIVKGECPYPDAAMEANDSFIAQMQRMPARGPDATMTLAKRRATIAETAYSACYAVGVVGGLTSIIFSLACAPLPDNAVIATCGVLASATLMSIGKQFKTGVHNRTSFSEHLQVWSRKNAEDTPRVLPCKDPLRMGELKAMIRSFSEDVKPFVYATELTREHERFLQNLQHVSDDAWVENVKMDQLRISRLPASRLAGLGAPSGRLLATLGCAGGAAAAAMGYPWTAFGLFSTMAAGWGLYKFSEHAENRGPQALRTARSLHYWEQAMAAAPPVAVEAVLFGTDPKPQDATIERSHEDVRIGKVVVPVKKRTGAAPVIS